MDFQLDEDQRALVDMARRLAEEHFAELAFNRSGFAWDSLKVLAEHGLTGITIPIEDGGQGGTLFEAVLVMEAISQVCPHSGDAVQATNFGAIRQLATFGSPRVKSEVLTRLLSGSGLITVAMSEPDAGSAVTELSTRARRVDGDVILDGVKCWSSHGPEATHLVVWCRFGPRTDEIGAVVVPTDAPGFSRGKIEQYMSGEHHCLMFLDNCKVPSDYVLADNRAIGKMMTIFNIERVGNAVRSLALAQSAFDRAVEHTKERHQFERPIAEFQGLQWKFADMRTQLDAARLLIYRAVVNAGAGVPDPIEANVAKLFANETAFRVANDALQIFGAHGYSTDSPVEYIPRRVRGWMIAGGSVEMLRNRIAEEIFGRRFDQRPPVARSDAGD